MRNLIIAAALFLASVQALAWDCFATPPIPGVTWPETYRTVETSAGKVRSWWCGSPSTTPGMTTWSVQRFVALNKHADPLKWGAASLRVLADPDPLSAANAEMAAARIKPGVGSQDAYEFDRLAHLGCLELLKEPLPATFNPPLTPVFCGAEPVPPFTPPASAWTVARNGVYLDRPAFKMTNGARALSSTARSMVGAPCDDSVTVIEGRSTYKSAPTTAAQTGTFVAICTITTPPP